MYNNLRLEIIKNSLPHFYIIFLMVILVMVTRSHISRASEPEDNIMKVPIYIVDAFTEEMFKGNPAAVCPLSEWLDDDLLLSIAAENNLSETAFFVKNGNVYQLRWFTPEVEVDLCGHGTLASAHVLFQHLGYNNSELVFETKSGRLTIKRNKDLYLMDFPALSTTPVKAPKILDQCLGEKPVEVLSGSWLYLVLFENDEKIKRLDPDFNLMKKLDKVVVVTAKGVGNTDFVSRCFAPNVGIPEDPVTGSSHCALVPFWSDKLGKSTFYAQQLSNRGGELYCEYIGDRVSIGGRAVTYSQGKILFEID